MEQLLRTLTSAGQSPELYQSPDGTTALILPHGARILGLYAPGNSENFFWTNSVLETTESARSYFAGDEWHNSGGDRTWLAPEADIFFPKFPMTDTYFQPRQLDPGDYRWEGAGSETRLVNDLRLTLTRSRREVTLRMTKAIGPALNPLRHEKLGAHTEYAGYTLRTSVELQGGAAEDHIGLWNLVQLPHGGDMWIPTYSNSRPNLIMGKVAKADLEVSDSMTRYRMRSAGEDKLGFRAVATAGRVGYLYRTGNQSALVIRNFFVNPSGEYVDVPWDKTGDFGYSTQACNIKSHQGPFSELEYHSPAIGGKTGLTRYTDESQLWAFRGDNAQIARIAHTLLSRSIEVAGI
jgi:hypothetical protein